MEELIKKLEAATGPDRALDVDIALAVESWPDGVFPMRAMPGQIGLDGGRCVPASSYTSSIDAALTLVPDGFRVALIEWDSETLRAKGPWQCILSLEGGGDCIESGLRGSCDHAVTPAIALCIAALRARAAA